MSGTVFEVSSVAELYGVLDDVRGGDTIELAAGTYDDVRFQAGKTLSQTFDAPVTIRSADPDAPAVLSSLIVYNATNLTFENITFDYSFTEGDTWLSMAFRVEFSSQIAFQDSHFIGDVGFGDKDPLWDGKPTAHGVSVRGVDGFTFENNEVEGFARGLRFTESSDVVLRGNDFHGQRMDHIVAAEVTDVLIEGNRLHDHFSAPGSKDHRDMIQFWNDNTDMPSSNVTIRGNNIYLGESDVFTQSIFIGGGAVSRQGAGEEMYYRDFTITENVIVNGHKNAIAVDHSIGTVITNNTLVRERVTDGDAITYKPIIYVHADSKDVTIADNVTPGIAGHTDQADWTVTNNVLIQDDDLRAPNHYNELFINPEFGARSEMANIQTLPGSVIELSGAGASRLAYDPDPDTYAALARAERDATHWTDFSFDAGFSAGPDGQINAETSCSWEFGDGNTADGIRADHTYTAPGTYQVTLRTDGPDGVHTTTTTVTVGSPTLLSLDTAAGAFELYNVDESLAVPIAAFDPDGAGPAEQRQALVLDGPDAQYRIDDEKLPDFLGAEDFQIDLTLASADWSDGGSEIMRMHRAFILTVNDDGFVSLNLTPAGEPRTVLTSTEALPEGAWTDLSVRFDGAGGEVSLSIDGEVAGEAAVAGQMPSAYGPGFSIGQMFGSSSFTGAISKLEMAANTKTYTKLQPEPGEGEEPETLETPAIPSYDLFDTLERGGGDLIGGADYQPEDRLVRLDGIDDAILLRQSPKQARAEDGKITVEIDYQRDAADGSGAPLVWWHQRLGIETMEDGLQLRVRTDAGGMERFQVRDLGLDDTDWHSLRLSVDSDRDTIQLSVDDEIVFYHTEADVMLDDPAVTRDWGWQIGGGWTGHLGGSIGGFRLFDNAEEEPSALEVDPAGSILEDALLGDVLLF